MHEYGNLLQNFIVCLDLSNNDTNNQDQNYLIIMKNLFQIRFHFSSIKTLCGIHIWSLSHLISISDMIFLKDDSHLIPDREN